MRPRLHKPSGRWVADAPDGKVKTLARVMMEEHLGRTLDRNECVHHINGDKTDDRIENLEVVSRSEHARMHSEERFAAQRAKWKFKWSRDYERCSGCGTTETRHAGLGLCQRCSSKKREHAPSGVTNVCPACGEEFEMTVRQFKSGGSYCSVPCGARKKAA